MIREGQIVLFRFPQTDLLSGKLRPALVLRKVPGGYGDWLICMVSSQLWQAVGGLDEVVTPNDGDYGAGGFKQPSVIRASRLAVVDSNTIEGMIGEISLDRLSRIRGSLARWLDAGTES